MAIKVVDLYVSEVMEKLNLGYTWYKKDDLGFGSIEETYGANANQIDAIKKHPKLKNAETNAVIFKVIDDTDKLAKEPVSQSTTIDLSAIEAFTNL